MGKPITEKCSTQGGNNIIKYAASSMQGCPDVMEDFHTTILDLNGSNTSFFGVYDGHGGADVARYCSSQFHNEFAKDDDYNNNLQNAMITVFSGIDVKLKQSDDWRMIAYPPGIRNLIRRLSIGGCTIKRWLWKEPYLGPLQEGCTTCMAVIRGNQITVGNIGDSRCVLSWKCESPRNVQALDLSTQHKPDVKHEKQRILKAGGQLSKNADGGLKLGIHGIEGTLPTSRSFGDFQFKQNKYLSREEQIVKCTPDIFQGMITNTMEFIVIASSGIWSVKSSTQVIEAVLKGLQSVCQEQHAGLSRAARRSVKSSTQVIEAVLKGLQSGKELKAICEELLDSCLAQGSKHNLSVIVVEFNLNQPAQDPARVDNDIVAEFNVDQPPPMVQDPARVVNDIEEERASGPTDASDVREQTSGVRSQSVENAEDSAANQTVENAEDSAANQTDNNDNGQGQKKKKHPGYFPLEVDGRRSHRSKSPRRHVKALNSLLGLLKNAKCVSTNAVLTNQVHLYLGKDASDMV